MAVKIGSNTASQMVQRKLAQGTSKLESIYEKLASGQRINKASDDAAGLAISSTLNADSRVFSVGIRNVNDAISAITIAQSALQELSTVVTRQKELAEQAANGVYSVAQRRALHAEADALTEEFNRVVQTTKFNDRTLIDGGLRDLKIQTGYGLDGSLDVDVGTLFQRNVGTGVFDNTATYADAGGSLEAITHGDFDGDEKIDMIIGSTGTARIMLYKGNGDGTFLAPTTIGTPSSRALAVDDINGDGILDIAVSQTGSANILLGNGNGTFRMSSAYTFSDGAQSMILTDMNNDGKIDLVGTRTSGKVSMMFGNGDGTFRAENNASFALNGFNLRAADFDGDGIKEIIGVRNATNEAAIIGFDASGALSLRSTITSVTAATALEVGDYNNDGYMDFAVGGNSAGNNFTIHIGNGNGTFKAGVTYSAGSGMSANTSDQADMNGDGYDDLVFSDSSGVSDITVALSNGDGTFKAATLVTSGDSTYRITLGDANRDGAADIIAVRSAGTAVGIYQGRTTTSSSEAHLYLLSQSGAREALEATSATLRRISLELGKLGSHQSRLETAARTLATSRENYLTAKSRITDIDVAETTSDLLSTRIIQQTAASVLAQANNNPTLALQLLKA